MPIEIRADPLEFHLFNDRISHVMRVHPDGSLGHLHFGARLAVGRSYAHLGPADFRGWGNRVGEAIALELPVPGVGDFGVPALAVRLADGSTVLQLRYRRHELIRGKPDPAPDAGGLLPMTYVEDPAEADTLVVTLVDEPSGLVVHIATTVFRDVPVIARHVRLENEGPTAIVVEEAHSLALDLPDGRWDLLQLSGTWASENQVTTRRLRPGRQSVGSERGTSGPDHNPFIALVRPETTETAGEAIGFSLVYSGNFLAEAEVAPFGSTRVRIGINPSTFRWTLDPGAALTTPEALASWSGAGLGALSHGLHELLRDRLARGSWRDRPRPILLNNWEATYFEFDEDRLLTIATSARDLGVELFVLDDGWFGRRDNDDTSLGDWTVDRRKLPKGLAHLAERVHELGLSFGLWIEPEMVSEHSELFIAHPEWAIGAPGRARTESRSQYVLDLSRPEVVDHLEAAIGGVLRSARIDYIKWDMNRPITEPFGSGLEPARQGEFFHRYVLGVYDLYRRLTTAHPDVLFESCASGGARFDPGLLAYAPQAWTSDDTDAIERLKIQWGTSIAYPLSGMGAHVAAVPNHQTSRVSPIDTRAAVAFFGVFGYELDPTTLGDADRSAVMDQIRFYRTHRETFQRGRFHRLRSPFDPGDRAAWMVVADDGGSAVVADFVILNHPVPATERLRLAGLDPAARYRIGMWPGAERASGQAGGRAARQAGVRSDEAIASLGNAGVRGGDELMEVGLSLHAHRHEIAAWGDFAARVFVLERLGDAGAQTAGAGPAAPGHPHG